MELRITERCNVLKDGARTTNKSVSDIRQEQAFVDQFAAALSALPILLSSTLRWNLRRVL